MPSACPLPTLTKALSSFVEKMEVYFNLSPAFSSVTGLFDSNVIAAMAAVDAANAAVIDLQGALADPRLASVCLHPKANLVAELKFALDSPRFYVHRMEDAYSYARLLASELDSLPPCNTRHWRNARRNAQSHARHRARRRARRQAGLRAVTSTPLY